MLSCFTHEILCSVESCFFSRFGVMITVTVANACTFIVYLHCCDCWQLPCDRICDNRSFSHLCSCLFTNTTRRYDIYWISAFAFEPIGNFVCSLFTYMNNMKCTTVFTIASAWHRIESLTKQFDILKQLQITLYQSSNQQAVPYKILSLKHTHGSRYHLINKHSGNWQKFHMRNYIFDWNSNSSNRRIEAFHMHTERLAISFML